MKKLNLILICLLFMLTLQSLWSQTANSDNESRIFAPFVSRLSVETAGKSILLSWKDANKLFDAQYHIYESFSPFDPESFIYDTKIATVKSGEEQFLYHVNDAEERYFLILAENEGKVFDVFIPYRNMSMQGVSAEPRLIQEENASLISSIMVTAEEQDLFIQGISSDPSRSILLFRSTEAFENKTVLTDAALVNTFKGRNIEYRDHVVPGIDFYYAFVDQKLYESGSDIILYDGSYTINAVSIALEEWTQDTAYYNQYASKQTPLPLLNMELDIESGRKLHNPGIPLETVDLQEETLIALAGLNFGKSVYTPTWKQPQLLTIDRSSPGPAETSWIKPLIEDGLWEELISRSDEKLKTTFDEEIRSRLHFYKGQGHYFAGDLNYAFMDFLESRDVYYSESNSWLVNIYEQKRRISKSQDLD